MEDGTKYVQARRPDDRAFESLAVPVHRASTVVFPSTAAFERRYDAFYDGYTYGLYGTPTSRALEAQLADLGEAAGAVLTPSGQSALTLALSAFLNPGDRVLVVDTCYSPVRAYCDQYLARMGVEVVYLAPAAMSDPADAINGRTRLILIESPGSNTMEFVDVPAVVAAARRHDCLVAMDNTWATSLLYKPHRHGVDIVVEALSKHAAGHGDVLMGVVTAATDGLFRQLKDMTRLTGLGVSADDCSLVLRGLQTMPVRMARAAETGLAIAHLLRGCPEIERVLHPAFAECPGHEFWRRDFTGFNGVFSIVLTPSARPRIDVFLDSLRMFRIGASWGGTQSLVAPQNPGSSRSAAPWSAGRVVRFSIGLEAASDLQADLEQALPQLITVTAPSTPHLGEIAS